MNAAESLWGHLAAGMGVPAVRANDTDTLVRALERIRRMLVVLLEPLKLPNARQIADEFARLVLVVADGAFVAQHIDPEQADVRRSFGLLRRALTALAREMDSAASRKHR